MSNSAKERVAGFAEKGSPLDPYDFDRDPEDYSCPSCGSQLNARAREEASGLGLPELMGYRMTKHISSGPDRGGPTPSFPPERSCLTADAPPGSPSMTDRSPAGCMTAVIPSGPLSPTRS
jgi:hypothetical protein